MYTLPPYSPDYDPIEEAFSYVKTYLREHDQLLQFSTNSCMLEVHLKASPYHCLQWITQCIVDHSTVVLPSYS